MNVKATQRRSRATRGGNLTEAPATPRGREALILAAERLIALHGLEGVSLRHINEAAKQKNASAAHYHFGSREAVIQAVLAYRLPVINARRLSVLEEIEREGRSHQIRGYVEALVRPLEEELSGNPVESFYLRFVEQYWHERARLDAADDLVSGWHNTISAIQRLLRPLAAGVAQLRLELAMETVVTGMAMAEALLDKKRPSLTSARIDNLIDVVTAGFEAPVSFRVSAALEAFEIAEPSLGPRLPAGALEQAVAASAKRKP